MEPTRKTSVIARPTPMTLPSGEISIFSGPTHPIRPPLLLHTHLDSLLNDTNLQRIALATPRTTSSSAAPSIVVGDASAPQQQPPKEFTYQQLQELSCLISYRYHKHIPYHQSLRHPTQRDDVPYIAFCARKSPELCIAMLGALRAGCAYLPIDYDWPAERFRYILKDARPALVVFDQQVFQHKIVLDEYCVEFQAAQVEIQELFLRLGEEGDESKATSKLRRPPVTPSVESDQTALILYTSGTTGEPKGVRLPHRGLMNALQFRLRHFPYFSDEVGLLKTVMTFSDSALEMFETWYNLRPLVVITKQDVLDVPRFLEILEKNRVYRMIIVPSVLRALMDVIKEGEAFSGCMWMVSLDGEPVTEELATKFFEKFPRSKLANFYGQTECCADLSYEIWDNLAEFNSTRSSDDARHVSIGRLIDNLNAYILDPTDGKPAALGTPGELYISGPSVCQSYIGTTLGKFLPNNLLEKKSKSENHEILLKTGDMAMYDTKQKSFYLIGRTDDMVKISGQKVHLKEVERAVRQCAGTTLAECVVLSLVRLGSTKLVAFVQYGTVDGGNDSKISDLVEKTRLALLTQLPTYAQPQLVPYQHEPLPRTEAGKISKNRLREFYQKNYENTTENDEHTPLGVLATAMGTSERHLDVQKSFVENGGSSLSLLPAVTALQRAGFGVELNDVLSARNVRDILDACASKVPPPSGPSTHTQQTAHASGPSTAPPSPHCSFAVVEKPLEQLDRTAVIDLVAESFGAHQDLSRFGEMTPERMRPVIEFLYPYTLERAGMSFGLVRTDDNVLVAVSFNVDNATQIPLDDALENLHPFHRDIFGLLGSVDDVLNKHVPKEPGQVWHAMMDAILPAVESASDKVALMYMLFEREIARARELHFKCIVAETASPLTAQLAHDFIKHDVVARVKPKDYVTHDGRMPWANYPDDYYVYGDVLWL